MRGVAEAEALLATVDPSTAHTLAGRPSETIVPSAGEASGRSEALLAVLAARGPTVELKQGRLLGEGGMGVVHEAEQVALGRVVAVKTLQPARARAGEARDLLREAWITGSLEHPNVVPVHHLEVDAAQLPRLILKRIDGVEWSTVLGDAAAVEARFGVTDLLAWNLGILGQVLNAVRFAHSRGVVHRDLKPSNVMVGAFGEVYLLDWGLAVSLRDDGTGRFPLASDATSLAGTPSYMAPEMLGRGGPPLSERTDVYLAGAVLYELVTGRPPHRGTNALAVISSVIVSEPELSADVPSELAQVIVRAMAAEPDDRYASIAELQLAVQRYLEHRGSDRLATSARAQVTELVERAAQGAPTDREAIYRQLAICRYALHEALAIWRDNTAARTELARGTAAVAAYELASGDPNAAVTLLTELADERHAALLAQARAAMARRVAERETLEALGREHDPTVGDRTRIITAAFGALFVVAPLVSAVSGMRMHSHGQLIVWALSFSVLITLPRLVWRRAKLTAVNRRVFAAGGFLFLSQAIVAFGAWRLGISVVVTQVLHMFLWGVVAGMFAITADSYLWLTAGGYFGGFLVAALRPDLVMFAVSASNAVFLLVVLWRWRPTAPRVGDRERESSSGR